jgi:hypothetical protein
MVDIVQNLRRLWDNLERHLAPYLAFCGSRLVGYLPAFRDESASSPRISNKYVWLCLTRELNVPYHRARDLVLHIPVVDNFFADDEEWRNALTVMGPLSNLCEFVDDEWHFVALQKDLCKTILKRLIVIQESLNTYNTVLKRFNTEEFFNPHIGYRRTSVDRFHTVYNKLDRTLQNLGMVVFESIEDNFNAIEARLTGTE